MAKYETQGHSKITNSYGAIGTIISTFSNGFLMIMPFDTWPYYISLRDRMNIDKSIITGPEFVKDTRLLRRVQKFRNCQKVMGLFKLPENEGQYGNTTVDNPHKVISAKFFPEWFYNPTSRNKVLRHISNWQQMLGKNDYPIQGGSRLEQFPFVIISNEGDICDIPWDEFLSTPNNDITFNNNNQNSRKLTLSYNTAGSAEQLGTKTVSGTIGGNNYSKNLGLLPITKFTDQNGTEYQWAIVRGTNITFVNTQSSIYLPVYQMPPSEIIALNALLQITQDTTILSQTLRNQFPETATTERNIEDFVNDANFLEDEEKYREYEHQYITTHPNVEDENLNYSQIGFNRFGICNLYKINKLTVSELQVGYSRLNPGNQGKQIFNKPPQLYPVVQLKGEGIMFEFDKDTLNHLINERGFGISEIEAALHSFSHCMMKELEFQGGYQINALKERLYFGRKDVHNVQQIDFASILIYIAIGSNSSFGGLCALFENLPDGRSKLEILISNAIERAKDCPNDPICITEVTNQNQGCCYACNLVPEIACEKFNFELSRVKMNELFEMILE